MKEQENIHDQYIDYIEDDAMMRQITPDTEIVTLLKKQFDPEEVDYWVMKSTFLQLEEK